jgi:taurine dioxygenase
MVAVKEAIASTNIEILPLSYPLGAEVRCGDLKQISEEGKHILRQAWLDNLVLLIRGQSFTPQDLINFAKIFGEIDRAAPDSEMPEGQKPRFDPHVSVVSNVVEDGVRLGSLGDGEVIWHSDHSYHQVPINASVLFAVEVPPSRGRTGFLNMYEALETLPSEVRQRIRECTIKHDSTYNSAGQIRRGMSHVIDVREAPGPSHPAIRTHPDTKHEALYLGRRPNAYVNGLSVDESERLINFLWGHATSRVAWYNEWQQGDVVIWDNRCVMHRREPFDPKDRRVMYRAQTKGTKPVLEGNASPKPHPRSQLTKSH